MAAAPSLSLDELVAVNDELAALVRAGVPLAATLGEMGRDMPGRLGRATTELANRIERGASLPQALAAMPESFPPMYRTAVEAGLRAGRLPLVLEDLAQSARRIAELRRVISLAALYPFILVFLTYTLFFFFVKRILPALAAAFEGHEPWVVRLLIHLGQSIETWAPLASLIFTILVIVWWYRMGKGRAVLRWIPVVGRMLRDARVAGFSETLGLLIDHEVPLVEAIPLAGEASGDRRLAASAQQVADELKRGVNISSITSPQNSELPPFFLWLIGTGQKKELLVPTLQQTAEMYRRRALRRADWIRLYIPLLMTLVIGGLAVTFYGLALFMPLTELLHKSAYDNLILH